MSTWAIRQHPSPRPTWRMRRIVDLVRLVNGFPFPSEAFGHDGLVPLLRIRDVLSSDFQTFVSGPVPPGAMIRDDDIVIGMDGDFNLVTWTRGPAALNQRLCALRPREDVDMRFLAYYLPHVLSVINDLTFSTTVKHLSSMDVLGERLLLPPLSEQRRIADFLDTETGRVDSLRQLTESQLKSLDHRLLELMREGTVQGGLPECRPTGVPWMPFIASPWRLGKVAWLFRTGSGATPSAGNDEYFGGGIPWINSADVNDGVIQKSARSITKAAISDCPSLRRFSPGSLVIAMYGQGETKGRVGLLGIEAYVNQACCTLTPIGGLIAEFAFYWFRAHKHGVVSMALGAGQPNLSQELIREVRIPVPEPAAQREIVCRLAEHEDSHASQRNALLRRNEILAERRQALITAAVTGRVDVVTARGAD